MRGLRVSISIAAIVSTMCIPVLAGQRGNSGNHGPSAHTPPSHPHTPHNAGPKTTGSNQGANNHGATHKGSTHNGSTSHDTNETTPVPTNGSLNFSSTPLGQKLTQNTALQSK